MLARVARDGVPEQALEEAHQLGVVLERIAHGRLE